MTRHAPHASGARLTRWPRVDHLLPTWEKHMRCQNAITVRGTLADVLAVAVPVQRWPMLFPHVRWVRVIGRRGHTTILQIAARGGVFPVRWTSEQTVFPDTHRIVSRHVKGLTAGMSHEWRVVQEAETVHITVSHQWPLDWLLIGPAFAALACQWLVVPITSATLTRLRHLVESGQAAALQRLEAATSDGPWA
jgi:hypothetical protein